MATSCVCPSEDSSSFANLPPKGVGAPESPTVVSDIDFSHRRPVQHVTALPPHLDFRRSLAIYYNPQSERELILSCGSDGFLFVWDVGAAVANAHNKDFLWRPITQCQLRRQDPGKHALHSSWPESKNN
ncbi:hypothetical protein Esti_006062 [Eimeria stiedai]